MTHRASTGTSETRLDKWFHSSPLDEFAWIDHDSLRSTDTQPIPIQSDHYPISMTLHSPNKAYHDFGKIWRLNTTIYTVQYYAIHKKHR